MPRMGRGRRGARFMALPQGHTPTQRMSEARRERAAQWPASPHLPDVVLCPVEPASRYGAQSPERVHLLEANVHELPRFPRWNHAVGKQKGLGESGFVTASSGCPSSRNGGARHISRVSSSPGHIGPWTR